MRNFVVITFQISISYTLQSTIAGGETIIISLRNSRVIHSRRENRGPRKFLRLSCASRVRHKQSFGKQSPVAGKKKIILIAPRNRAPTCANFPDTTVLPHVFIARDKFLMYLSSRRDLAKFLSFRETNSLVSRNYIVTSLP